MQKKRVFPIFPNSSTYFFYGLIISIRFQNGTLQSLEYNGQQYVLWENIQ